MPDALYFHQDEMGSVRAVTDSSGAVLERYDYGDFGTPVVLEPDAVTVRAASIIGNQVMYTGRGWLPEFDLYDYRHRFMDPRIGRFIQRDPVGYRDGMNVFGYVGHGPYNATDPLGLWGWDGDWLETLWNMATLEPTTWGGFGEGALDGTAATVDGFVPFYDPMQKHVRDYDPCDPLLKVSYACGGIARDALLSAVPIAKFTPANMQRLWMKNPFMYELGSKTVSGSTWARLGLEGMNPVQRGIAIWNEFGWRALGISRGPWRATFAAGPTPGGAIGSSLVVHGLDAVYNYCSVQNSVAEIETPTP